MDIIKFPGLRIEFNISRVAFEFLEISIYFYAVCIVLGIGVAFILARISKEKFGIKYEKLIEIMVGGIVCGYIGARLYYVVFNFNYYISNPSQILNFRDGGLAIYGGLIFSSIFVCVKCKKEKINFLDFGDYIVPFVAIAQSIGRWGNFFNKEAYGISTLNFLRMGIFNYYGEYVEVHPTFLYESIATFIIFIFLRLLQKNRKFSGQILYLYIIFYSFIRIFIEGLRVDSLMLGYFRVSQILSLILFTFFSYILLKKNKEYCEK